MADTACIKKYYPAGKADFYAAFLQRALRGIEGWPLIYGWGEEFLERYVGVDAKCQLDPSLAVAHGCFWRYHPDKAFAWELRLQDELGEDFRLDEKGSDFARERFVEEYPERADELVAAEMARRAKKAAQGDDPEDEGDVVVEEDDVVGVLGGVR